MQLFVIYLLFDNLNSIGGTKGFTPYIAWTGLLIVVLGIAAAAGIRAKNPQVYDRIGRYVNSGA